MPKYFNCFLFPLATCLTYASSNIKQISFYRKATGRQALPSCLPLKTCGRRNISSFSSILDLQWTICFRVFLVPKTCSLPDDAVFVIILLGRRPAGCFLTLALLLKSYSGKCLSFLVSKTSRRQYLR